MPKIVHQQNLFYRAGSSDKVYNVVLEESDLGRYRVLAYYGRRGNTLKEVEKCGWRNSYYDAVSIYDECIAEKRLKGYRNVTTSVQPTSASVVETPKPNKTPKLVVDEVPEKKRKNKLILDVEGEL